jgi:type I protein arginine methyltransferase
MRKEDATFLAPFSLVATRNDYVHAFVAYFDVSFNDCHRAVGFSTGPRSRPTHWKQTVFYLKETLCIHAGEVVVGELKCEPNAKNPRDLDIQIKYKLDGEMKTEEAVQDFRLR